MGNVMKLKHYCLLPTAHCLVLQFPDLNIPVPHFISMILERYLSALESSEVGPLLELAARYQFFPVIVPQSCFHNCGTVVPEL